MAALIPGYVERRFNHRELKVYHCGCETAKLDKSESVYGNADTCAGQIYDKISETRGYESFSYENYFRVRSRGISQSVFHIEIIFRESFFY